MRTELNIPVVLILSVISALSRGAGTGPVGWASLNGGTTGGAGGDTLRVTSRDELLESLATRGPAIILIRDTIELNGGECLPVHASNITLMGEGRTAMIRDGGLMIFGNNVIIQNLSIGDSYIDGHWDGKGNPRSDCLSLCGKNIWVDHCELFHSFDGLLDVGGSDDVAADYITVSWTRFRDHNKVMLIGSSDRQTYARDHLRVTLHHCWFDGHSGFYDAVDEETHHLTQRMPRVRFGDVHVFNNYYEGIASYCIAARLESDVVAERNYFRNLKDPHIIEDRGMGLEDPDLVVEGNVYENVKGRKEAAGRAFNPSDHYPYPLDEADAIPSLVMNGAGKWNRKCNSPPFAVNDVYRVTGMKKSLEPLDNDSDPDGDPIRISRILNHPAGETRVYPDRIIYYRPEDAEPSDAIAYEVIDFEGGVSVGTIEIINEK